MEGSFKRWFNKIFVRDIQLSKRGWFNFLVAFVFFFTSLAYLLLNFIIFNPMQIVSPKGIASGAALLLAMLTAGYIVDIFKDRIKLLIISGFFLTSGIIFFVYKDDLLDIIGTVIVILSGAVFAICLFTIVIHESTILNRGRIYAYLFFFSFIISFVLVILSFGNPFIILVIEIVLLGFLIYIRRDYSYIETPERLKSEYKLRELTSKHPIMGYLGAFMVLGFIIGNAYPYAIEFDLEPISFIISIMFFFILTGLFLDNMGRKWSFTGGILILSALIIFSGIFADVFFYSIFFGIAIPILFITLFTFSGDFSTERNTVKYRGRIIGVFLTYVVAGFVGGYIVKYLLTEIYIDNPNLYFMPELINGINSFLLVVLLVWIMPLKEVFSSKEADWSSTLRNLYVFNRDSICLFAKNFIPEDDLLDLPPEDLITGGLTGILTLISEITNERKKNLRIIDKDRVKIYFAYGKNIIVALISSKFLPILFKKLEVFTKSFEREFEVDLLNFRGKINVFLEKTDKLVAKYFR